MPAGGATILVVEDEAIVAMDLDQQLQEMGYDVCGTADNAADAIALATRHRPNLVLMDIVIKGDKDGVEAARDIGSGLNIPVVFLTAYSDKRTVDRAAQTAPYGYLTKPFQPKELRAIIEVAMVKAGLERRLRESEQWFASTLRCVGDGVIATDPACRVKFMNPVAESVTGWRLEDALGRHISEVFVTADRKTGMAVENPAQKALQENSVVSMKYGLALTARDGKARPIDDSAAPICDDEGHVLGAVVAFREVSDRLAAEEAVTVSEERFRNAFEFAPAGMALVSLDGRFLRVNAALSTMLDRTAEELLHMNQSELIHLGDVETERGYLNELVAGTTPAVQFEKRLRTKTSVEIVVLAGVSLLQEKGKPLCFLYQLHDLTERKKAEQRISHLAYFDSLTGLANRLRLRQESERMLGIARRHHHRIAVLFLDLDHFKQVNDTLGHEAGDRLLESVAHRLIACVRDIDCVARLGGDEFVVLLTDVARAESVAIVTEKIRKSLTEPFSLLGHSIHISPSIGVSIFPEDGDDTESLFRCADAALYLAKSEGRNNTQFYRPELTARIAKRFKVENALHRALERQEFMLYYQPIVSLATGKPIAAEALIRWKHPDEGIVEPDAFIPIAEESGLILEIGEWVLREACREAVLWREAGAPLTVTVNVSPRQFKTGDFVGIVADALRQSGLSSSSLSLEITEETVVRETQQNRQQLADLKALGVGISIDDFGVGYSSLSYLKRFGPDSLKIDRSFVRDVANDADDAAIVGAVIAMSHRLKIDGVAEGVETDAQRVFLGREGCEAAQGFFYGVPCAADQFRSWLKNASSSVS